VTNPNWKIYSTVWKLIGAGRADEVAAFIRNTAPDCSVSAHLKQQPRRRVLRGYFELPFLSDLYLEYLEEQSVRLFRDLTERESYDAWDWSFLVESAINALIGTGDTRYDTFVRSAIEHALKNRDSERGIMDEVRQRSIRGWGLPHHLPGKWTNVVTTAGRITTPILQYVGHCIAQQRSYPAEWVEACEEAAEEFAAEFVVSEDGSEGVFYRPTRNDVEPLNHAVSMGRALLRLGTITGRNEYLTMARQLAVFFRRSIVVEEGCRYAWPYRPSLTDRTKGFPSPFWKADIDLAFVVDCYRAGVEFGSHDFASFVASFKGSILQPGWLNCYVSATDQTPISAKAKKIGSRSYGLCGWQQLVDFAPEIQSLIENVMFGHQDIVPGGWLGVPRAALGYSLKR
jgi:hypothetical protein